MAYALDLEGVSSAVVGPVIVHPKHFVGATLSGEIVIPQVTVRV